MPSTIHSATSWPMPPAPASPCAQKPAADPEAADVRRPEDELAVGRERLRAVDEPHDLRVLELRHADDGVRHQLLEALPVLGEQLAVEVGRDPVEAPRGRVALVAAHDEPAGLAAEVHEQDGSRIVGTSSGTPCGCVTRYSCAIGTTGTLTPASAPISPANMPPAFTTTSVSIDALVGLDARHAAALDADSGHPRRSSRSRRRRAARPRRARTSAGSGRCSRRSGGTRRRARRRSTSAGRAPAPRSAETSSSGSPNVFAQPAWRAAPPSAPRRRRAAATRPRASRSRGRPRRRASGRGRPSAIIIFVRLSEPRSWPTSPAEWNVEPLVRSARSTSTTSSQPSRVSQ